MFKGKNLKLTIMLLVISLITILSASRVPRETIIAEYRGGTITMGQLEDKTEKIPPMYRNKYKTEDGMKNLLDIMCTEEIFYQEALALNIQNDEKFWPRIENQIKSLYLQEYKKDLSKLNVVIPEQEKQDYFKEHCNDYYAGRVYEEAKDDVDLRLRPQKEEIFLQNYTENLKNQYNVEIHEDILKSIDFDNLNRNNEIADQKFITSSNPDIEKTVSYFQSMYEEFPPQLKNSLKTYEGLLNYVNTLVETDLYYQKALEKNYGHNENIQESSEQIRKNMMLKTVYNKLVIGAINMDDEHLKEYYNKNIAKYSSKPSRKIQAFSFDSNQTAKKYHKKVKKALKKNDKKTISKIIEEYTLYPKDNGVLNYIYKNGIIPGVGYDEVYSNMVWETPAGKTSSLKLSKIFENSKGEFVFFRILEDNIAEPQPFVEIIDKVRTNMTKELSRKKFEELTNKLKTKYNLVTYEDRMIAVLTSEEYFNLAEEAQKKRRFQDAIYYYDKIIKNHKNNSDDYKALFMKAFLYSEELNKKDLALQLFNELIENYPEGDLHESARFMCLELEGETNIFEDLEEEKE